MTSSRIKAAFISLACVTGGTFASASGSEADLLKALPSSKQTLAAGIKHAQANDAMTGASVE